MSYLSFMSVYRGLHKNRQNRRKCLAKFDQPIEATLPQESFPQEKIH